MKKLEHLLTGVSAILIALLTYNWETINLISRVAFIVGILSSIVIAVNSYNKTKKEALVEKVKAKYGEIKTKNAITPTVNIGWKEKSTSLRCKAGVYIHDEFGPLIKVNVKKGKMLVNVVIRDFRGKVIAVIDDSEWTIFSKRYEYNNDDVSFEMVIKGERHVFFQAYYKKGIIYLSGYFLNEKGGGISMFNQKGKSMMNVFYHDTPSYEILSPKELNIPCIFKYPRKKYFEKKIN